VQILHIRRRYQLDLLLTGLRHFFGDIDEAIFERALPVLEWLELTAGETLFEEGDPGNEIYFLVSGRLRATASGGGAVSHVLSEIARGEAVGEISLITREPRAATVTAIRPAVLVRLSRTGFENLLMEFPEIAMRFTRLAIERLQRSNRVRYSSRTNTMQSASSNIAIIAISPRIDPAAFADELGRQLAIYGKTLVLTSTEVRRRCAETDFDSSSQEASLASILWLDEAEAHHEFVLLVAEPHDGPWTKRCLRHADEILLVADAADSPALHPLERDCLSREHPISHATRRLILLQEPSALLPRDTASWLRPRDVASHVHIRSGHRADIARLGRIISGRAIGLVLSGGGARGYAHLGVYHALWERGIEVDYVGGTSMGAAVGSLIALGIPPNEAIERCRRLAEGRMLSDYNFLPMLSLLRGRRLDAYLSGAYAFDGGRQPDIEDTWKEFFCVAASYSYARQAVLRRGPLAKMVRASLSIPAYLPPVFHETEALVDGGVFNNFPTDVMAANKIACLIGVDLRQEPFGPVSSDIPPSTWQLLKRRLLPWTRTGEHRFPSLADMLYRVPTLASSARQIEAAKLADMLIRPDLSSIGMLEWKALDRAVDIGFHAAHAELERISRYRPDVWRVLRNET
jgi:NTE family protein